jgi:hypothetical protein
MLEAFDPAAKGLARSFIASLDLSEAALTRLESGQNIRRYLDRLVADGLLGDALVIIARALPPQLVVAWGCECTRQILEGAGSPVEAERTGLALAEQCLKEPTIENRQLCLEFAEGARRLTASAWMATAAAWADGPLTPPTAPVKVDAPAQAVEDAVVAALRLAASREGKDAAPRLATFVTRALTLFGPRAVRPS